MLGVLLNWIIVVLCLCEQIEYYDNSLMIFGFLGVCFFSWVKLLCMVLVIVIVVFFVVYIVLGFVGGGKLFVSVFGGDYMMGILLMMGFVLVYMIIGGFLVVSLMDFVQGCIMMLVLVIMFIVILIIDGGVGVGFVVDWLIVLDLEYFLMVKGMMVLGWLLVVVWGLGYFGQLYIIVCFMVICSVDDVLIVCNICMLWMIVLLIGVVVVGIFGYVYVLCIGLIVLDFEMIFIILLDLLFYLLIIGFLYVVLLVVIMLMVLSQLLVVLFLLIEDIYYMLVKCDVMQCELVNIGWLLVLVVGIVVVVIVCDFDVQVFSLVLNVWVGFGVVFGLLIVLVLIWKCMIGVGVVVGLIVGVVIVILWIVFGLNKLLLGGEGFYEIVLGFIVLWMVIILVSMVIFDQGEYCQC